MASPLSDSDLAIIFRDARTYTTWQDKPVSAAILQAVYELTALGPTSMNMCPARIHFVVSAEAKARLKPHLAEGNVEKTMKAPATAIIGYDLNFFEEMPRLFPARPQTKDMWANNPAKDTHAFRNGTLQGAYFIIAARALGLDCGPMSGFNADDVDAEFFSGTQIKTNFLCNVGYGDPEGLYPRNPRLPFDDVCKIL